MAARALEPGRRAKLYAELAALHRAGLSLDRALTSIAEQLPTRQRRVLLQTAAAIKARKSLDLAGRRSGLLSDFDARLIAIGESAGRLPATLDRLHAHYAAVDRRSGRLAAALVYPAAVLVLAGLALPLPGLVSGQLSAAEYLATNALTLLGAWLLLRGLPRRLLLPTSQGLGLIPEASPLLGPLSQDIALWTLLQRLYLQYASGVPIIQALHRIAETGAPRSQKHPVQTAAVLVENGNAVADALRSADILDAELYGLLQAGEAAGRFEDSLQRCLTRLDERIDYRLDLLIDWLPRLSYGLIVAGLIFLIL